MNALHKEFGGKLNVLGVFCNQFGHQTNEDNNQIALTLKHVRPGNGFESLGDLFSKVNVNGADAHPLFKFLKSKLPYPTDPPGDTKGNGCDDNDALILPRGNFDSTTITLWSPVCRSDIAWNFEKFLLDKDGTPVKRYSRYFDTAKIAADVKPLL
eukprot:gnl/MRDRNA2_/MRDRNA2_84779_c0_seq2.p1 gnl/MRDRNA2_/MRDRNA2_84779_c0~~gnl/MRDRNA2_/MRDRNA2_84779_c0_seq2.p1  ORF type:complete len:155 (+),score=23.42 gnl/MRDRNA2_/MRDRNA2_84779_c0_seq2:294-758(+)